MTEQAHFAPGTLVIDLSALPPVHQPWFQEIRVYTVREPSQEIMPTVRPMTETEYCQGTGTIPLAYDNGQTNYRNPQHLRAITPEQAALDMRGKIAEFLGPEALANYDRHN